MIDLPAIKRRAKDAQRAKTQSSAPFRNLQIKRSQADVDDLIAEVERLEQLLSGARTETASLVGDLLDIASNQ